MSDKPNYFEKDKANKRYLVFAYDCYYPSGGMGDMQYSFDDHNDAIKYVKDIDFENLTIYDRIEGKEIDF